MISNIIKIATRIILRNKIFSLINILGLSIGLACSLLIMSMVRLQSSFDKFHENADHIFCLQQIMDLGTGTYTTDLSGGSCGPALANAIPGISAYVRFSGPMELLLTYYPAEGAVQPGNAEKKFMEEAVLAADSNFFSMFSFHAVSGNLSVALDDPYSLVMTKEMAEKYFGNDDPQGQYINVNGKYEFTVTGVIEDIPLNSSIQFDFLINFNFLEELGWDISGYDGNPYYTFLYLDDPAQATGMDTTITNYLDQFQSGAVDAVQKLLPLTKYHSRGEDRGHIANIIFTILAGIILAIACINFMNLSTARYLSRTREVGLRKVVGARWPQLIRQFIGETMVITFIAMNLAILLIDLLLPLFNRYFELEVTLSLKDPVILAGLLLIFVLTSLVSGSYPAFFLSSFNPVIVLGRMKTGKSRGGGIRKILVVVQFLFASLFITASIVTYKQFRILDEHRDEFESEGIIYLPARGELNRNYEPFKQELLRNPGIESVTSADFIPNSVDRGELEWGITSGEQNDFALVVPVSYDFDKTFHIEMEEGRFYSADHQGDSAGSIIINRKVADAMGLEDPLGHTFYLGDRAYTIIGIVREYTFNPLSLAGNKAIMPFSDNNRFIFLRLKDASSESLIEYIEEVHQKYNPEYPFDHFFWDEYTDPIIDVLGIFSRVIYFFTFFGIFISCLGLLGLSVFSTEQRTKEIGIRKAVGASSIRILRLIVSDFLRLVLISLLIAIPVSILLMKQMLQLFADRIGIGPGLFLMTAIILLAIALITVSFQVLRSAMSNPSESLRYE